MSRPPYAVTVMESAIHDVERLPAEAQRRVADRIARLAEAPRMPGTRQLRGRLSWLRRARVGDYRVLYTIDDKARTLTVWEVGHRRHVYDD